MSDSPIYLCYDLKGIQSFIFAVPRLKYICGGSAIIDDFDRKIAPAVKAEGAEHLFSGGGKGAYLCPSDQVADQIQGQLVEQATHAGLGISFGRDTDYSEAANVISETYPWLPADQELDGRPCTESGLYPVSDSQKTHRMIRQRDWKKGERVSRRFEEEILDCIELPGDVLQKDERIEFMHNVNADDPDRLEGRLGSIALGGRNRWAIIAMDGNDMGMQHRVAADKKFLDPADYIKWLKRMSQSLDDCSRGACAEAAKHVIQQWAGDEDGKKAIAEQRIEREPENKTIVLPFRPLIVGGDDIVVLCHVSYAMEFVKKAALCFAKLSREKAAEAKIVGIDLWPATEGELSITAGVLFTPVSMPLAAAIPYTESLMASAKNKGRELKGNDSHGPTPSCVDWEAITEGLLDTPAARRQREFWFVDPDLGEIVQLTQRPYSLQELDKLEQKAKSYEPVPATIRYQILPGLRQGFYERRVFCARLGKQKQLAALVADIEEDRDIDQSTPKWRRAGKKKFGDKDFPIRSTNVVDALLLLEEKKRMTTETAGANTAEES